MRARTTAAIAAATIVIPFVASASAAAHTATASVRATIPAPHALAVAAPIPSATAAQAESGDPTPPRSPLNIASDKVALTAYVGYLTAILKATSAGQGNSNSYISTVASQCRSALAPLTQANFQVSASAQATLTAVGEEMGDDLSITFDQAFLTPFAKLSGSLERLKWTRLSAGVAIVRRFIAAQSAVLYAGTSDLCQSALLAAASPQLVPPNTKLFNKNYSKTSRQANAALAGLLTLMQSNEIPSEKTVVSRISTLAAQISRVTKAYLQASASSLSSVLENG